jgi:hypothetical protein
MLRTVLLFPSLLLFGSCAEQASNLKSVEFASGAVTTTVSLEGQLEKADTTVQQPSAGRHVIYRATISLDVHSFADSEKKIAALVKDAGGYIASYREHRLPGAQRGGQWSVRVPVSQFDGFLEAVAELGVPEHRDLQSQDVTEEYVDLGSRLKNKHALEARLLQLVADRTDEIKDVLALEAELSRVREEIEKIQGRLRFLTDRIALTTIDITVYERTGYRPPQTSFGGRLASSFLVSLDRLRQFLEGAAVLLVVLAPWAVLLSLVLAPAMYLFRKRRRSRLAAAPTSPV